MATQPTNAGATPVDTAAAVEQRQAQLASTPAATPLAAMAGTPPMEVLTAQQAGDRAFFDRKLAADDAKREAGGKTRLRCVAQFTLHTDGTTDNGETIRYGQLFDVHNSDLPTYLDRYGVRVFAEDEPAQGVIVQRTGV